MTEMTAVIIYNDRFRIRTITYIHFFSLKSNRIKSHQIEIKSSQNISSDIISYVPDAHKKPKRTRILCSIRWIFKLKPNT